MGDLNKQLARLEARVKGAENAINGHVLALSKLSEALASNPFTANAGAVGQMFYNGTVGGFQVLLDLVGDALPSFDDITNLKAEALVKAAGDAIDQTIQQIEEQIENAIAAQIESLNNMLDGYINQIEGYAQQIKDLTKQIEDTSDSVQKAALMSQKETAEKLKAVAETGLTSVQSSIDSVMGQDVAGIKKSVVAFVMSQKNLRKGVSQSLDLKSG